MRSRSLHVLSIVALTACLVSVSGDPVAAQPAGNRIVVTEWCDPAPCLDTQVRAWGPSRTEWIAGVIRLNPRITPAQAQLIWEQPNKWWRNHIPWQRKTTNWSTINPSVNAAGGFCAVTTRNSGRNGFGERLIAVYHHKEWHGDHTWDVANVSYNTWIEITDEGSAYHLDSWSVVDDWWSTRGGTGSLHSFHGSRRQGLFRSLTIPILGFSVTTTLSTYMGAYYDRTVETGNNDRQSCYTID